ncbi:MAG: ABC transporter ATP-binding protein [Thaumarchaeota archaeon]|nr:ABC transporter ATP-binding protein [Nitrososphaerota archaeon]
MSTPLLKVEGLRMHYQTASGYVKAVDGVNFELNKGEVLGVVGESGCGKSSLAGSLLKLLPKNAKIMEGKILLEGEDLVPMGDSEMRSKVRWTKISLVPQGAMNALNPIFRVGDQIAESMTIHTGVRKAEARARTDKLLELVGVDPSRGRHYPHEFSGGMKQRAMIAMALSLSPKILIADEPTTALDVIVQAGIIELMLSVRRELGTSIILISHDLALVAQMSDKVIIMYAGKIVEYGQSKDVYINSLHPYTLGLQHAFADIRKPKERLISIPGSPPDLVEPPTGCRFNPRCPYAKDLCRAKEPELLEVEPGHMVACHFWEEVRQNGK